MFPPGLITHTCSFKAWPDSFSFFPPLPSCQETDASQKCLDAYNYNKSMCSAYFQAYKDCRKYWVSSSFFFFFSFQFLVCVSLWFFTNDKIEESRDRRKACLWSQSLAVTPSCPLRLWSCNAAVTPTGWFRWLRTRGKSVARSCNLRSKFYF